MIEAYFDESGSHEGSPILCVAGFIIEADAAREMEARWQTMLDTYRLPFFHMVDCAHGVEPFDILSRDERIAAEKEAISIIRNKITYGIAVTVNPVEFEHTVPKSAELGSAYSLCAHMCLTAVRGWATKFNYPGNIAYVFEAGHASQSEANAIMIRIFDLPHLRADHRYVSHTFGDKRVVLPLQAADVIAWQWFTERKRVLGRTRSMPRLDYQELMLKAMPSGASYHAVHMTEKLLRDVSRPVLMNEYPLTYPGF